MTEWNASDYHRQSSLQQAMAEEQLGLLQLAGTERILDVGCGDGKITAKIAALAPRGSALGVDPSMDMVAFATKNFGAPVTANLRFEVGDVRQLPFKHEFDLVVSFNALHWVEDQDAALHSIHEALKPGGRALLRFVPESERKSVEDIIEEIRQRVRWAKYFSDFQRPFAHFTADEYREMAQRNGFRVDRLQALDRSWDFKTREGFVGFCRATFVEWTKRLPESERLAFITDALDHYQSIAADHPHEAHTFKFFQLEVVLTSI